MEENNLNSGNPHQIEQIKELQEKLTQLYNSNLEKAGTEEYKEKFTQKELEAILYISQPTISRTLRGYEIDWKDEWKIKKKTSASELVELTKGIVITKTSTFFIAVPPRKRKKLKESLLMYFPSSRTQPGIIHIKDIAQPSGLLVFSDDHNLEYSLTNDEYLQHLENEMKNKH